MLENKDKGFEIALKHYEKAYSHFKKVNHLFGVYLSMKHITLTYDSYVASSSHATSSKQTFEELSEETRKKAQYDEERFREYIETTKRERSPYIERVHGEEISLLTEIVYNDNLR